MRTFVPEDLDVDSAAAVTALYEQLEQEELAPTAEALRNWLLRWSEVDSVLLEVSSRRYVKMTCDTRDPEAAKAYSNFVETISPIQSEYTDKLNKKFVQHPALAELEPEFGTFIRAVKVSLELFRPENIPLSVEEVKEVQAYQKITGGMAVDYEGETRTLQQMSKFLEATDRARREDAWKKIQERRLQDKAALDDAYDKLFKLRNQISKNAGCKDYIEYIFKVKNRFDYTPKDCKTFHQSIEDLVLPLERKLYERKAKLMGLERLRPWDTSCDALSRPPLKPFETGEELIEKCCRIYEKLDPRAGAWIRQMQREKLIDPDSRLGKAPGGYQIGFDESRKPFIFMNAAGADHDIYTLLHEAGHSFHQFGMAGQPIAAFRDIPSEFAEVASMSMELIGMTHLSEFYPNESDAKRSRLNELEEVIWLFPWVASIDSFQHELYSRPGHTAHDREAIWSAIMDRYDAGIDYTGFESVRTNLWQKQLHLFECPFYYVEYGIAQLGALQVWANFKQDPQKAFDLLFAAESLGSSRPLPELFAKAGIKFDFSARTIEPLVGALWEEFEKLA